MIVKQQSHRDVFSTTRIIKFVPFLYRYPTPPPSPPRQVQSAERDIDMDMDMDKNTVVSFKWGPSLIQFIKENSNSHLRERQTNPKWTENQKGRDKAHRQQAHNKLEALDRKERPTDKDQVEPIRAGQNITEEQRKDKTLNRKCTQNLRKITHPDWNHDAV